MLSFFFRKHISFCKSEVANSAAPSVAVTTKAITA